MLEKFNLYEHLKWSLIATASVTLVFILCDLAFIHTIIAIDIWDSLARVLAITFSYFVPALVTSVLTLLIQSFLTALSKNIINIGINNKLTVPFLIAWFVYTIFYIIYLKYTNIFYVGLGFLIISITFVFCIIRLWMVKIDQDTNSKKIIKNSPI